MGTSVFSAFFDERLLDRLSATREFWLRLGDYEAATSEITRLELRQTRDAALRSRLLELLESVTVFPITAEMEESARRYVEEGVFSASIYNDALHVAAAVFTRHDVLISWNFKHLVNRKRRSLINQVNLIVGWPTIDILAPPEV